MGKLDVSGVLTAGPQAAGDSFPSANMTAQLKAKNNDRGFNAATGVLQRRLSVSSPTYAALSGVGASDTVTKGTFLYLKSDGPILIRLTHDDGVGGNTTVILPLEGMTVIEFQDTKYLKLLEAQGSALLEYFVCGPQ